MTFLLDTNICIAMLNAADEGLKRRFAELQPGQVSICSVVKAELIYGARKSRHVSSNLSRLDAFLAPLESHPFDDAAADMYGSIRVQLEREGKPIGPADLMMASIACARDLTLVTRNQSEFRRVSGLRVEEW